MFPSMKWVSALEKISAYGWYRRIRGEEAKFCLDRGHWNILKISRQI